MNNQNEKLKFSNLELIAEEFNRIYPDHQLQINQLNDTFKSANSSESKDPYQIISNDSLTARIEKLANQKVILRVLYQEISNGQLERWIVLAIEQNNQNNKIELPLILAVSSTNNRKLIQAIYSWVDVPLGYWIYDKNISVSEFYISSQAKVRYRTHRFGEEMENGELRVVELFLSGYFELIDELKKL